MFDKFYLTEYTADVHFKFENENIRLPAHKVLLAAKSDVFLKMFFSELKENGDIKIECEGVPAVAFKEFLRYFYFENVELPAENLDWVLFLGRKYLVEKCVNDCVNMFAKSLNNGSVCAILERGLFYDLEGMTKMCTNHISVNTSSVLNAPEFSTCPKAVLKHIFQMDLLSCCEVEVFEAAIKWVQAKSGKDVLSKTDVMEHLGILRNTFCIDDNRRTLVVDKQIFCRPSKRIYGLHKDDCYK